MRSRDYSRPVTHVSGLFPLLPLGFGVCVFITSEVFCFRFGCFPESREGNFRTSTLDVSVVISYAHLNIRQSEHGGLWGS